MTSFETHPLLFDRASCDRPTGFFNYIFYDFTLLPVFSDDDTRVKLIKGKNDYVNANYVTVSFFSFLPFPFALYCLNTNRLACLTTTHERARYGKDGTTCMPTSISVTNSHLFSE